MSEETEGQPFHLETSDPSLMQVEAVRQWLSEVTEIIKKKIEEEGTAWWPHDQPVTSERHENRSH